MSMGDVSSIIALQGALKFNGTLLLLLAFIVVLPLYNVWSVSKINTYCLGCLSAGGGHINHTLFWENLTPNSTSPKGALESAIKESFGDVEKMKAELSAKSIAVQGSGWGWLGYNTTTGRLEVATCANQDPLHATTGLVPLLGIDVWEHAYYVDYRNVRPKYVEAIWNVINWDVVEARLKAAK